MKKSILTVALLVVGCSQPYSSTPPQTPPPTIEQARGSGWVRYERFDLYKTTCYYLIGAGGAPSWEGHLICLEDAR